MKCKQSERFQRRLGIFNYRKGNVSAMAIVNNKLYLLSLSIPKLVKPYSIGENVLLPSVESEIVNLILSEK